MNERARWLFGQTAVPGPARNTEHGGPSLSPAEESQAAAIARQTMSPFCPGRTLADCPSEYATEWRQDIRQMLADGRSAEQIQDELERRAGANLSGIPAHGTSYWVPAAFALLGVGVLASIFVRLRKNSSSSRAERPPAADAGTAPKSAPIDDARLEAELRAEGDDDR
jgi:cytochrome c-type biogenesis protein CcmH/NrfF